MRIYPTRERGNPMEIEQISVFMENKAGRLARVTDVLSEAGIYIKSMIVTDTTDFGVLRMLVDDPQKAVKALENRGFASSTALVNAVELKTTPHEMHKLLLLLNNTGINVEYMYAYTQPTAGKRYDHDDFYVG